MRKYAHDLRGHSRVSLDFFLILVIAIFSAPGCSSLNFRIKSTNVSDLPSYALGPSRDAFVPVSLAVLSQRPPQEHLLDVGDTVAIVLPGLEEQMKQSIPILTPEPGSGLAPAAGMPVPVQADGTIRLPLIAPLDVKGMTLAEASDAVKKSYRDSKIIIKENFYPIVSLFRPRTYTVTVIREDTANIVDRDNLRLSTSQIVELPAYQNDVLNALVRTGGLPGLNAKPEVRVIRQVKQDKSTSAREEVTANRVTDEVLMLPTTQIGGFESDFCTDQDYDTIPLRILAGTLIDIASERVILRSGDIILVESRDAEVFYTGGLIPGAQHLLPRDYDIDVFEAMAIAGYSVGSMGGGGGGGGGGFGGIGGITGVAPTNLYVFRKLPNGKEVTIRIKLSDAANDRSKNLTVQPGDKLLLRHSAREEITNFSLIAFFTFGVQQLLTSR